MSKIVCVAYGEDHVRFVEENDPEAINLTIEDKYGEPVWNSHVFNTEEEADAFKLGLAVSRGYYDVYWVDNIN